MTQEEKDLLLKDLCGRLPYGVKVQSYSYEDDVETIETLREIDSDGYMATLECETLKHIAKPYLFPMSSMTEEQEVEFLNTCVSQNPLCWTLDTFEWLNKNHFDYNYLISDGLANDATNKNIY